jgi:hypothetical protein
VGGRPGTPLPEHPINAVRLEAITTAIHDHVRRNPLGKARITVSSSWFEGCISLLTDPGG